MKTAKVVPIKGFEPVKKDISGSMKNVINAKNARKKADKSPVIDLATYPYDIAGYEATKLEKYMLAARMFSTGSTYSEIAENLGIAKGTAYSWVKKAREFWLEQATLSYQAKVAQVYSDIDVLIYEAYEGWKRSIGEVTKTVHTSRGAKINNVDGSVRKNARPKDEIKTTTEHKAGDAAFLGIVARCIDRKAAILGLEKEAEDNKGLATFLAKNFGEIPHSRYLKPTEEDLKLN